MKVLIWFFCFFVFAVLQMLIKDAGIILGGIPTALLAGLTFWIARKLCEQLDIHRLAKKTRTNELPHSNHVATTESVSAEPQVIDPPKPTNHRFCKMCGGDIDDSTKKCTKCGKQYFRAKRLVKPLCVIWAIFTVCLLLLAIGTGRYALQQTEKLNDTERLLESALASEAKYWKGYCEGSDIGYRHGYFTGIREVLTEQQIFSLLYKQYQADILDKSTTLDYDTWLEEQIGHYMTGYLKGFDAGKNDYSKGYSFSTSYGGHKRTDDRLNASYVSGQVDGYNDGYAYAAYPDN